MRSDINDFNRAKAINLIARKTLYKSTGYVLFDCSAGAATSLCCVASLNIGVPSWIQRHRKAKAPKCVEHKEAF